MKPYIISFSLVLFLLSACGETAYAVGAIPSPYVTPWITYTPSPYPTTTNLIAPVPQATTIPFVTTAKRPPACMFPLPQTTLTESVSEQYSFSEPKVVLPSGPREWPVQIIQWLPDSQRVLLVQDFDDTGDENIEVFNLQTGDLRVYATRHIGREPPAWLADLDGLIYSNQELMKLTGNQYKRQLWSTRGDPNQAQLLEDKTVVDMPNAYSIVIKPDGSEFAYRAPDDTQLFPRDAALLPLQPVAFDPAQWDYRDEIHKSLAPIYVMAWRPGTSQIFIFSYPGARWPNSNSMGYTFLLDTETGKVCEFDFGGWASFSGLWSPNGRYLAIDRVPGSDPTAVESTDLAILDAATGKLYSINDAVAGFAWAPDNHHLLTIKGFMPKPPCPEPGCEPYGKMYLTNFLTGEIDSVLPADQFAMDWYGMLNTSILAWSPDGSKVLALCPELCLITVQKTNQK